MPPAPAAIVGQRYGSSRGPWRKLKQIGEGSFGKVFLVQKNGTGPTFVMKEVALRGLPRSEMISAQNEVAVLKKIQHPHCIRIEEALVAEETLCIVMEYADGKDLDTLVKQRKREGKPLSEEEVLKIFWQLTSALAHCHHDLHMLHRDLKPANVFMMASGDVKLGDFGLAKIIEATCALAKTQCGTPLYMSPELCVGKEYDRGADVWALGCILYELMTLTMPWADVPFNGAGGMSALLRKIANSSLDLTPCKKRYSLELVNLCSMLLAKNGKNRPSLNSVLQMDLAELTRLPAGLARVDLLLDNWDKITTVCNGVQDEVESRQVVSTQGERKCSKTPLKVQQYIGASSTKDPLFKADKLMIRAQPLVADEDAERYSDAVDTYITKQQMSSTMAYTSSWSGIENPNGSIQQIEDNLLEAKKEVLELRAAIATVVELLRLPTF